MQQQNAAVQNTALNNLAAALNLTIQPQIAQSSSTQAANAAAAAALFQQNPFSRPFLPIFSFASPSPWQYAAAAAALQPLPERCIIQPGPVHVFQQPTVNVVVKPQSSVPLYGSHKSSHKSQKNMDHDELKITLNPSRQSSNSFHKSTSAPTIGVSSSSSSYQVKIKTESKPHHKSSSSSNYDASYLKAPENLLSMTDEQQLQHLQQQFQQQTNSFLHPNINNQAAAYFAKMFQNTKLSPQQQQQQQQPNVKKSPQSTQSSPTNLLHKKSHHHHHKQNNFTPTSFVDSPKKLITKESTSPTQPQAVAVEVNKKENDEIIKIVDDKSAINDSAPVDESKNNNKDEILSVCSSSSTNKLQIDLDNNKKITNCVEEPEPEQQQQQELSASPVNTNTINADSSSSNNILANSLNGATIQTITTIENKTTITNEIPKLDSQKFLSPSSTVTNFFNDEDFYDNENSISSFSLSLKANRKLTSSQLWRTSGDPFVKLVSINVKFNFFFFI